MPVKRTFRRFMKRKLRKYRKPYNGGSRKIAYTANHTPQPKVYSGVTTSMLSRAKFNNKFLNWGNLNDAFPTFMVKELDYAENFTLTTGTVGVFGATQAMALNGCYDPNITGTGHQPYYWDQCAALYSRYRVLSVAWTIRFTSPISNSAGNILCGAIMYASGGGGPTLTGQSADRIVELPNAVSDMLSVTGNRKVELRGCAEIGALFTVTKTQYETDSNTSALTNGNPATLAYLQFAVASLAGVSGDQCAAEVKLTYRVHFFDRTPQSQS